MTFADANAEFSSTWDIDQLIATAEVTVSSGDTTVYIISDSTKPNVFEVQFKPSGSKYYRPGTNSTDGTLANIFTFYTYINGTSVHIVTTASGTARYFVWQDRINQ